jgi:hypothetical protein
VFLRDAIGRDNKFTQVTIYRFSTRIPEDAFGGMIPVQYIAISRYDDNGVGGFLPKLTDEIGNHGRLNGLLLLKSKIL